MKDIDFDELDRAVNSLMSGAPKASAAKADDVNTATLQPSQDSPSSPDDGNSAGGAPSIVETASSEEAVSVANIDTTSSGPQPAQPPVVNVSSTPPAVRRRGKFMDVVRPTAPEPNRFASRPVSRQGSTLQPTAQFASSDVSAVPPAPLPAAEQATDTSVGSSDWPDPLEAVDFNKTTEAVEAKAAAQSEQRPKDNAIQGAAPWQVAEADIPSPFLPDAKVEKRPLGRTDDMHHETTDISEPQHAPVLGGLAGTGDDAGMGEVVSEGDVAVPQQPLPVELGHEVMAIEADTSTTSAETVEHEVAPSEPEAKPATPPLGSLRPPVTSIPQQYKVQPKSADPSPGAIYDTATYHQPLTHPAKKQPGWLWIIAIVLILIFGAASGAAVYFFGLV